MIIYRKAQQLRIQRSAIPAPPFWAATSIAPYGARRAAPIAIDYLDLRASYADRMEVTVCANVRDALERSPRIAEPALIDAARARCTVGELVTAMADVFGRYDAAGRW